MKKWLYFAGVLATVGILARLPHPAKDISKLEPVQLVYIYEEAGALYLETDTGARGAGKNLTEAQRSMAAQADGAVFLETAEFLVLDQDVIVTAEFFTLLRPGCRVVYTNEKPDLPAAAKYLSVHTPKKTLRELR